MNGILVKNYVLQNIYKQSSHGQDMNVCSLILVAINF